jgi:AMP deaminase
MGSRRPPSFYQNMLGPPDPIDYLRGVPLGSSTATTGAAASRASSSNHLRRLDSDDEGIGGGAGPPYCLTSAGCGPTNVIVATTNGLLSGDFDVDRTDDHVDQSAGAASSVGHVTALFRNSSISPPATSSPPSRQPPAAAPTTPVLEPPARERPSEGETWPHRETLSFTRSLVFYGAGSITKESERACKSIQKCRHLRQKYHGGKATIVLGGDNGGYEMLLSTNRSQLTFNIGDLGVCEIHHTGLPEGQSLIQVPSIDDFYKDYNRLVERVSDGEMRSFCFQRLQMLSTSFKMHNTMNGAVEQEEQNSLLGTDFYRTLKIDNHIHAAAAPSARQFVEFVRGKLASESDTVVTQDGKTLKRVFIEAGLDHEHLTIDSFNVLADYSVYQRFDNFNSKYSPFRLADMRRIFLKTTNHIHGRFFAELLKIVIDRHEKSKGHTSACEMRLSIYGMERHEWYDLAKWVLTDWAPGDYYSGGPMISTHNRWHIQIPRLWRIYSQKPMEKDGQPQRSFREMLENLFVPLFEATMYPDEHPEVAELRK